MLSRLFKLFALGGVAAIVIYFLPQEVNGLGVIRNRFHVMYFAFTHPWWPPDRDNWKPFVLSVLVAAILGGATSGALLKLGILSRARGSMFATGACLISISLFVAAPYHMSYFDVERPRDLFASELLPYLIVTVFAQWLILQNVLLFNVGERTLKTTLSTMAGSMVATVVSVPIFFYTVGVYFALHEYLYPSVHLA